MLRYLALVVLLPLLLSFAVYARYIPLTADGGTYIVGNEDFFLFKAFFSSVGAHSVNNPDSVLAESVVAHSFEGNNTQDSRIGTLKSEEVCLRNETGEEWECATKWEDLSRFFAEVVR